MNVTDLPTDVLVTVVLLLTPREAHRLATVHPSWARAVESAARTNAQFAMQSASLMAPRLTLPYEDAKVFAKVAYCDSNSDAKKLFVLFQHLLYRWSNDGDRTWKIVAGYSGYSVSARKFRLLFDLSLIHISEPTRPY